MFHDAFFHSIFGFIHMEFSVQYKGFIGLELLDFFSKLAAINRDG